MNDEPNPNLAHTGRSVEGREIIDDQVFLAMADRAGAVDGE